MQISFHILDDTHSRPNPMHQKRQVLVETQPEINMEEYEKQFKSRQKTYLIIFAVFIPLLIGFFCVEGAVDIVISFIEGSANIVIFLFFSVLIAFIKYSLSGGRGSFFDIFNPSVEYYNTKQPDYIKKGKITFEDEGISITQNTQNVLYKYKDMTSLNLFYLGISLTEEHKRNSLKWEIGKEKYEYCFFVGSYYSRNQLIEALKYLYQKKVEIKEWTENWEALYLLSLPERPEPSKEENNKPIEEKYLRMIDEIGKKEDEF